MRNGLKPVRPLKTEVPLNMVVLDLGGGISACLRMPAQGPKTLLPCLPGTLRGITGPEIR
jgi:hypothetical protein